MFPSVRAMHRRGTAVLLGIVLGGGLLASGAEAARVRSLGLADMTTRAGRIFVGRCTARVVADDAKTGLPVTTYTFIVTEPIKGVHRGPVSFRLPGTPDRPLIPGLSVFEIGEEALLLLYPESEAGFSSAMGLDQGRFRLRRGRDGSARAINGRRNHRLLEDVPAALLEAHGLSRESHGPLHLPNLVGILRALASGSRP